MCDSRFAVDSRFDDGPEAGPSHSRELSPHEEEHLSDNLNSDVDEDEEDEEELAEGMDAEGFSGPSGKVVKPLTPEALAAYKAAQEKTGVIYISRIPPGMRPTKVRHLMSQHGEVGRVYLQPEDAKRSYLRKKYTSTKKIHFTEGWVEFKDKKVARSVADLLNAQPIGGKKGTRWRDDVWTMKYLPKFKWRMLTEQIAHEAAIHAAQLRVELSQSRKEQQEYLKNVELARVLDKRAERKRKAGGDEEQRPPAGERPSRRTFEGAEGSRQPEKKRRKEREKPEVSAADPRQLDSVLSSIF
ncbi:hypothetical protein QCA50_000186 [Cerrena zonata]|uniref:18S rRNA factor 2 n=1 Tax=Cerrena zonata TaxID=2478898 RepID=A0AAW0GQQ5_9APHY